MRATYYTANPGHRASPALCNCGAVFILVADTAEANPEVARIRHEHVPIDQKSAEEQLVGCHPSPWGNVGSVDQQPLEEHRQTQDMQCYERL